MGPSGASLGRSWAFFGRFLGLRNEAFIKHWSKMVSKRPSGSILEGFGEGSGRIWGGSWEDFGSFELMVDSYFWFRFCHHECHQDMALIKVSIVHWLI